MNLFNEAEDVLKLSSQILIWLGFAILGVVVVGFIESFFDMILSSYSADFSFDCLQESPIANKNISIYFIEFILNSLQLLASLKTHR
jgi:hypothetical protein